MMKIIYWVGSAKDDLLGFPQKVREEMGYALYVAQKGSKHPSAKPLKGFRGAGVLEVVENYNTNTYRLIYTLQLKKNIYVLHAFQKKSKQGISTPQHDMDVVEKRMKQAEEDQKRRVK